MNNNINYLNEDNKKSKSKIKENEDKLKNFKNENENIINELSKKYSILEDKLNKLSIQNDGIINNNKIIRKMYLSYKKRIITNQNY